MIATKKRADLLEMGYVELIDEEGFFHYDPDVSDFKPKYTPAKAHKISPLSVANKLEQMKKESSEASGGKKKQRVPISPEYVDLFQTSLSDSVDLTLGFQVKSLCTIFWMRLGGKPSLLSCHLSDHKAP